MTINQSFSYEDTGNTARTQQENAIFENIDLDFVQMDLQS
jgi:hypothetical protein